MWRRRPWLACLGLLIASTNAWAEDPPDTELLAIEARFETEVTYANGLDLAYTLRLRGQNQRSIEILRRLDEKFPGRYETAVELASAYEAQGELTTAIEVLQLKLDFREWAVTTRLAELWLKRSAPKAALRELSRTRKESPSEPPTSAWVLEAVAHTEIGDLAAARTAWEVVVQREPFHPDHWLGLGRVLELQGEMRAAERIYGEAVRAFPGHNGLTTAWGACLYSLGDFESSIPLLERAVQGYRELDDIQGAEQTEKLLQSAKSSFAHDLMAHGDLARACPLLEQAAKAESETPEILDRITCARVSGRPTVALQLVTELREHEPFLLDAVLIQAELYREQSDVERARTTLQAYTDTQGYHSTDVVVALASAQIAQHASKDALETLKLGREALGAAPAPLEFLTTEAAAHEDLGDLSSARLLWQEAMERDPAQLRLGLELSRVLQKMGDNDALFALLDTMEPRFSLIGKYWTARAEFELAQLHFADAMHSVDRGRNSPDVAFDPEFQQHALALEQRILTTEATLAVQTGDETVALDRLAQIYAKNDAPENGLKLGHHLRLFGHTDEAETLFRALLEEFPSDIGVQLALPELLLDQQRAVEAEKIVTDSYKWYEEPPSDLIALYCSAVLQLRRPVEAVDALQDLFRERPETKTPRLLGLHATALTESERYVEASETWLTLAQKYPDIGAFSVEYAVSLRHHAPPKRVVAALDDVIVRFPDLPEAWAARGSWFSSRGEPRKARADYDHAIGLLLAAPASGYWAGLDHDLQMARTASSGGQTRLPIRLFEDILTRQPSHRGALTGLGWQYFNSHRWRPAQQTFEARAALEPANPTAVGDVLETLLASENPSAAARYERQHARLLSESITGIERAKKKSLGLFGYRPVPPLGLRTRLQWITSRPTAMLISRELAFSSEPVRGFRTDQWVYQVEADVVVPRVPLIRVRHTGVRSFLDRAGTTQKLELELFSGTATSIGAIYAQPSLVMVSDHLLGNSQASAYRIGKLKLGWRPAHTPLRCELSLSGGSEPTDRVRRSAFVESVGSVSVISTRAKGFASVGGRVDTLTDGSHYRSFISEAAIQYAVFREWYASAYVRLETNRGLPVLGYATGLESNVRLERRNVIGVLTPFAEANWSMPFRAPLYQGVQLKAGVVIEHGIGLPTWEKGGITTIKVPFRWTAAFEHSEFPRSTLKPSDSVTFGLQVL